MGIAKKTIRNLHEKVRAGRQQKADMTYQVIQALQFWERANQQAEYLFRRLLEGTYRRAQRETIISEWIKKLFKKQTLREKYAEMDFTFDKWRIRCILGGMKQMNPEEMAAHLKLDVLRVKACITSLEHDERLSSKMKEAVQIQPPRLPNDKEKAEYKRQHPEVVLEDEPEREPRVFDEGVDVKGAAAVVGG